MHAEGSSSVGDSIQIFSAMIFITVLMDFSDRVILLRFVFMTE